jgi:DNA transformation protein
LRAAQDQDPDHIAELFAAFGPVAVRHMFGGAGIFADGLMIALVSKGAIYLKADDSTIPQFEREGLKPFTIHRQNPQTRGDVVLENAGAALRRSG